MKRTWKKLFAFVCAFTLVVAPVTYNTVNADAPGLNSNGVQIGNVSIGNNSTTSSNNASVGTDYTLTIPATLNVSNAGWNATDGITAKVKEGDTFDSSKKLSVTASSENEWNLKSGENLIAYKIASDTDQDKSYSDATAITSLKISADQLNNGTYSAPFGIVVDDYTDKPAGEYTDTVTFTAKVEDAVVTHTTLSVGDVIHLGEVLSISTTYFGGGQAIQSSKSSFTLVRANVTDDPSTYSSNPVTEAEDGQYYVLKGIDGSYCVYIGTPGTDKVEATSTSDGIIVNTLNGNRLYFTTHEPQ